MRPVVNAIVPARFEVKTVTGAAVLTISAVKHCRPPCSKFFEPFAARVLVLLLTDATREKTAIAMNTATETNDLRTQICHKAMP